VKANAAAAKARKLAALAAKGRRTRGSVAYDSDGEVEISPPWLDEYVFDRTNGASTEPAPRLQTYRQLYAERSRDRDVRASVLADDGGGR
jgi:hypothetical protein